MFRKNTLNKPAAGGTIWTKKTKGGIKHGIFSTLFSRRLCSRVPVFLHPA